MTGIAKVVDQTLIIDGVIRLRAFDENRMDEINAVLLWDYLGANRQHITKFGDETWRSPGNKLAITFTDATPKLAYQLKAMALGMYTQGTGEGMEPLSWSTIRHLIGNLKRFGTWLERYDVYGLDELNELPELRFRNIIHEMVLHMKIEKKPSIAQSLLTAMYWVRIYGLIENTHVFEVINEYLTPYTLLKEQRRNKHAIIPPRILKILLSESEAQVIKADAAFESWHGIQLYLNDKISSCPPSEFSRDTYIDVLTKDEQKELAKYHQTINTLRRYVFVLVLSYTGMRYSEAMALPDDAAIENGGKYYIKTLLSKTTDRTQYLEWTTNKITHDAVVLLARVNQVYRQRAELLLAHHGDALPEKRRLNMEFGILNSQLFNVSHHKQSCEFSAHSKATKNGFTNINTLFSISVTAEDIELLNRMGCNYQSVNSNHKGFKKPYKEGMLFNFTAHQFRHTFAWFIIANRLGDLDDIKYQYKHLENSMTLVYSQRGYESMEELIKLTESFSEFMVTQAMGDMVQAAEDGVLAGRGGQSFMTRLTEILNDDLTTGSTPHFSNMQELLVFAAKHTSNFRGLSHGYCTKSSDCKVRNAADPSHCIYCQSYIATPKHLPHWIIIKKRCESQLQAFEKFPEDMKKRFLSFSTALTDNLSAANTVISQLTINIKEA